MVIDHVWKLRSLMERVSLAMKKERLLFGITWAPLTAAVRWLSCATTWLCGYCPTALIPMGTG